jgi:hypothetical protein
MDSIILNYGCPRTGTTFVNQMLSQGIELITGKIAEGHSYHPIKSNHGLMDLKYTFQRYNLVFVRTIRDPISIFESFYHARKVQMGNLGKVEDDSIKKMIELEKINTVAQSKYITIVTLDFNEMQKYSYISEKINEICRNTNNPKKNSKIYLDFIEKKYNKIPIRQGILSDNARETNYLSEEKKQEIMDWYQNINIKNKS